MNQAIQIVDGFEYDLKQQAIKVIAINNGALVNCFVLEVSQHTAEAFYTRYQFDIEEQLSALIEEQKMNEKGEIFLTASELSL